MSHSSGDSVAIGILSPSSPTSIPTSPFSPSLISLMVSVDVKHHVYLHLHPPFPLLPVPKALWFLWTLSTMFTYWGNFCKDGVHTQ